MKDNKVKVIAKRVGMPAELMEMDNTYEAKKEFVGGNIEYRDHPQYPDIQIVCCRDSVYSGEPATIFLDEDDTVLSGNCLFITHDEDMEENISLSDEQISKLKIDIEKREINDKSITVKDALYAMRQVKQFKKDYEMG